ncbi:MAG: hypothetical protein LUH47_04575 [Clostridiales bacterium]|nr:hypothetical protein [Clostridiales bacterium]
MALKQEQNNCLRAIGEAFNAYFNFNLYFCTGNGKTELMEMYPFLYNKWLSQPVSDKLPVSGAGLISEISNRYSEGDYFAFPYVKPDSFYRYKNFSVNVKSFTAETHPVIDDLKFFLSALSKSERNTETEYGEIVLDKLCVRKLKKGLNIYSPYYTEYLYNLALELELIEIIPSVNRNIHIFRPSAGYNSFFEGKNIFNSIFDASIRICRDKMNEFFPEECPFFTGEMIKNMLIRPINPKEVFSTVLNNYELDTGDEDSDFYYNDEDEDEDFEDFYDDFDFDDEDDDFDVFPSFLSKEEEMKMTSFYVLSISLSKWFFDVFGMYLNVIRTYGIMGIETFNLMELFLKTRKDLDYRQKEAMMTLLPESYNLTAFGFMLFPEGQNSFTAENEVLSKLSLKDTFEDLTERYDIFDPLHSAYEVENNISETNTYLLKVYSKDRKKPVYKYMEFSEYNFLSDICTFTGYNYSVKSFNDFSIYTNEKKLPFSEYTSIKREGRTHKKAETTFLNEVFSKNGDKLWIELRKNEMKYGKPTGEIIYYHFEAELIETGKKCRGREYPVVREVKNDRKRKNDKGRKF